MSLLFSPFFLTNQQRTLSHTPSYNLCVTGMEAPTRYALKNTQYDQRL